jgi:hypothetical protein
MESSNTGELILNTGNVPSVTLGRQRLTDLGSEPRPFTLSDCPAQSKGEANIKENGLIGRTSGQQLTTIRAMMELDKNGFTIIPNVFSKKSIFDLNKEHETYWRAFKRTFVANRNGVGYFRGRMVLFLEKGRYDLDLDFGIFRSKRFLENTTIKHIVNNTIKTNYISYAGSLPSVPNSKDGSWHRDVYSLFEDEKLETSLPVFYLTVLIPLVDIDANNGATEFIVGSHKGGKSGKRVIVEAKSGSAIICNGMVYHRGRANKSNTERHMLYIVYCKKWYNDYV